MSNFVTNTEKLVASTKTVNGKDVPAVVLAEDDRIQLDRALVFIKKISATLARHEDVNTKAQELAIAQAALEQDNEIVEVLQQVAADKAVA
jgi:hypothetical protein